MSTNSYLPPHLRNKQVTSDQSTIEQPTTMERRNPFQKERRAPRRPHEKPFWQIQQENEKLELEEKKKAAERGLEDTAENFPTLGGNTVSASGSIWSGGRKFSELATDWKSTDDQRKEEEERQKNRLDDNRRDDTFQLPRFRSMRRFSEPEDECCEDEAPPEQPLPEEEKWTLVDNRKYRKPKKEFDFSEELDDYDENGEDETVWGAPEEHETCWDDRR
jgi:hypothetical protein